MREGTTRIENHGKRHCSLLCAVALAAFALFAGCEQLEPEPEPEQPTPPVINPDTLPMNKFVGTWVLCAMNDVNSEPPATCDLANATTDTLVFTNDNKFTLHRGANLSEYWYEFTEHYLVTYRYTDTTYLSAKSIQYNFRENDEVLVLRGIFYISSRKNYCFRRVTND